VEQRLDLAADDGERGAQFVGGVAGEPPGLVEAALEPLEHLVEDGGKPAEIVAGRRNRHAPVKAGGPDRRRAFREGANGRERAPGHPPTAETSHEGGKREGEQVGNEEILHDLVDLVEVEVTTPVAAPSGNACTAPGASVVSHGAGWPRGSAPRTTSSGSFRDARCRRPVSSKTANDTQGSPLSAHQVRSIDSLAERPASRSCATWCLSVSSSMSAASICSP